jgi:hypothetical protein
MKTNSLFLILPLGCLVLPTMIAYSGPSESPGPPGKAEAQFVVRPHGSTTIDAGDLAAALGISHWNFQIQVPEGTSSLRIAVRLIQNGAERNLGDLTLNAEQWDSARGKAIKGPKQFRTMVVVSPLELAAAKPLLESTRLRLFAKEFLSGSASVLIIDNPFLNQSRGVTTYTASQRESGEASRNRFDLFSTDDYQRVLRISFERH